MSVNTRALMVKLLVACGLLITCFACNIGQGAKDDKSETENNSHLTNDLTEKEYLLMVGNPGVGKSTLINSLLKKQVAPSGVSYGGGLTKTMRLYEDGKNYIVDTPGLAETEVVDRLKSAKEIEKALKLDGKYRIFFVMTLEAGRVRADDVASMNLIMDAINVPNKKFNVIINKASRRIYKDLNGEKASIEKFLNAGNNKVSSIYYLRENAELLDSDTGFIDLDESFKTWFYQGSLATSIKPSEVSEPSSEFDRLKNEIAIRMTQILSDMR